MEQIFLSGIGLICIMLSWKYVWVPTALDGTRDALFDLRDNVLREHFTSNKLSFESDIYKNLRLLLNGHLRHTESLSIWEFIYFLNHAKNVDAVRIYYEEIDSKFKTDDPELIKLVERIRIDSTIILMLYMLKTSVFCMVVVVFYMMPKTLLKSFIKQTSAAVRLNERHAMEAMAIA